MAMVQQRKAAGVVVAQEWLDDMAARLGVTPAQLDEMTVGPESGVMPIGQGEAA